MRNLSVPFWVLASILIAVNVGGWLWVGGLEHAIDTLVPPGK